MANLSDKDKIILLDEFRKKFLKKDEVKIEKEVQDANGLGISIKRYAFPRIPDKVKDKIENLKKIASSIEDKIVISEDNNDETNYKINYKASLNESQYLAVKTINGPVLVIAGAGSGKTRTIIYRLAYMIEKNIDPHKILLLTFTRKASNEMLERANKLLNDSTCNNVMGGTFHSFANYILRKYYAILGTRPNFTIIDAVDSEDIIDLIRQEMKFDKKTKAFPKKSRIQTIISKSRNCDISIEKVIENEYKSLLEFSEEIQLIAEAYGEYKNANNILDYDDLMDFLRYSLKNNEVFRAKVQRDFHYIMVDEFQDTNAVQKEIVDLIAGDNKNLMVVGDDSQSIYAFRGANIENILRFPETYPDCKVIKLEQNYRSNQAILDFTNSINNNSIIGYKKSLFSNNPNNVKPVIKKFHSQMDEASFIVKKILEMRENNIPLSQISVLFRSSFHSTFVQAELVKSNIPYLVYGGIKFTERRHVKDIVSYLRVVFNPMDSVSWNRILKIVPGVGTATSSKLISQIHQNNGELDLKEFKNKKFTNDLDKLLEVIKQAKNEFISIASKVEILKDYYSGLLKTLEDDYELRMLDLDVIYTLACNYEKLEKFLSDFALEPPSTKFQDKTTPLINESEEKPLILSTVHSSKGLEWHSVFLIHLLDGLLPSSTALGDIEALEEERRLFYVACTRAKENLFLTLPSSFSMWDGFLTMPSRFMVEIDSNKYKVLK